MDGNDREVSEQPPAEEPRREPISEEDGPKHRRLGPNAGGEEDREAPRSAEVLSTNRPPARRVGEERPKPEPRRPADEA